MAQGFLMSRGDCCVRTKTWAKRAGIDCKSAGLAFAGSCPASPTSLNLEARALAFRVRDGMRVDVGALIRWTSDGAAVIFDGGSR
jgi:hypothetical protein